MAEGAAPDVEIDVAARTPPLAVAPGVAPVEVRPVRNRFDRWRFVDLPFRIFGRDPEWVPPLCVSVHDRISPKHPANAHQETALWIAYRRGRPVARIGACVDRLFNEFQGLSWAWIGFFESFDDPDAAAALFDTVWRWARARGATTCVGPASFTTNDECGLLVQGFKHPPLILTPHNPPYYQRPWVDGGWEQTMDLSGWRGARRPSRARGFALGVAAERQQRAVGPLLYAEIVDRMRAKPNIEWAEASWILATNTRMNSALAAMGAVRYKTWRLYERRL